MKKNKKHFKWLIGTVLVINTTACSAQSHSSLVKADTTSTKKQTNTIGEAKLIYPFNIQKQRDSIVFVAFAQTAASFYLNMNESKSKRNLEILKESNHKNLLVNMKADFKGPGIKILEVELASAEASKAFQESWHTGPVKTSTDKKP